MPFASYVMEILIEQRYFILNTLVAIRVLSLMQCTGLIDLFVLLAIFVLICYFLGTLWNKGWLLLRRCGRSIRLGLIIDCLRRCLFPNLWRLDSVVTLSFFLSALFSLNLVDFSQVDVIKISFWLIENFIIQCFLNRPRRLRVFIL